jgi:hypothetical protein
MNKKYFDKNGTKIIEGMTLIHEDGDKELVYKSDDGDLGFNASNESNTDIINSFKREIYPLYQFNLKEWRILE